MATDDAVIQEQIMEDAIATLANYNDFDAAPVLCREMHTIVKRHTGVAVEDGLKTAIDDYAEVISSGCCSCGGCSGEEICKAPKPPSI